MTKVSIIIPVYGVEAYLRECLDSVLAQTLKDIEVVCIDDGSPDGCPAILDDYAGHDGRIKVIHQANAGAGPARNAGLAAATGEFVAFMDADDRYPDGHVLEDVYGAAIANGVDACGGSLVTADGKVLEPELAFAEDGLLDYSEYQYEFGYYRFIFRRSLLLDNHIDFPSLRRFQDVPFFVEAMHASGKFYALKRNTYCYRTGHQVVEWSANNARKAVDNVKGMLAVRDLAMKYGYRLMVERAGNRLADFIRLLGSEANGLRCHRDVLVREVENQKKILDDLRSSVSFRIGRLLTAPLRCCRNLVKGKAT